jgi:YrhK-like protein
MQATSTWELPAGWVRISSETWGPFVIRELVRRPDGEVVEFTARRHRKGYGPRRARGVTGPSNRTEGRPHAVLWAPREIGWWVGVLFMIGSACFAVGSVPSLSEVVSAKVISSIYFVGSQFFTSAGYLQYVQASSATGTGEHVVYQWFGVKPRGLGWWAAAVQLLGTLFFNVTTFEALNTAFTVSQQNLRVWSPDFFGSICFLVASWFAVKEEAAPGHRRWHWRWRWNEIPWRIVWLNMVGSIFFMISAIAAFVRPATDEVVSARIDNSGTFLGAVCFLWGAWLLLLELADSARAPVPVARTE